ncbi:MAG: head-tail connector protein [Hyphomicrobiaceae bacterium]
MSLVLTSGPAVEPVALDDAKAHLRIDGSDEDTLIASLIVTSRLHIETALDTALIAQDWSLHLDAFPPRAVVPLPLRPVAAVAAIRLWSDDGTSESLPATDYLLDGFGMPARIVRRAGGPWPAARRAANGIEIAFTAGYGDSGADVPAPLRQALLLLVAHWHAQREPVVIGDTAAPIPSMVSELLAPYRPVRL